MNDLAVALETSARAASVAVRGAGRTLEIALEAGRAHASDLLPAIDRLVRDLGGRPADVASVLVGTGPGSYTGLRVGIATAIGIVRGTRARVRGVPSGETLVFGELEPAQEACVLLDARAGDLYFARYRRDADEVHVLRAPCVLRPEEVLDALPAAGPIFGDASAFEAAGLPSSTVARVRMDVTPRAAALLALGSGRLDRLGGQQPSDIQPLYLRAFAVRARRR